MMVTTMGAILFPDVQAMLFAKHFVKTLISGRDPEGGGAAGDKQLRAAQLRGYRLQGHVRYRLHPLA
jgi:hypothetical protein